MCPLLRVCRARVWLLDRVTIADNALAVVYAPNPNWLGADMFTYRVLTGVEPSAPVTVTVNTRKCRLSCANDVFNEQAYYVSGV